MKQFSIKGLSGLLSRDSNYLSFQTDEAKNLFNDKCNWLISEIIRRSFGNEDNEVKFQNINSKILRAFLGRNYVQVIDSLEALDVVKTNNKYSANRFSKSYSLSNSAVKKGIIEVEIFTQRFQNKLSKILLSEFQETVKDEVLNKVIDNTAKLKLIGTSVFYMARIIREFKSKNKVSEDESLELLGEELKSFRLKRYHNVFNSFKELNTHTDSFEVYKLPVFFKPKRAESGRIYHLGASVPKFIREGFITKKKEIIYEVDMASAQPSILFLEWMRSLSSKGALKPAENAEYELCRGLFLEGGIYAYIRDNSNYYSQFKSEEKYGELKEQILTSLNGKNDKAPFVVALKELFPHFMKWVIDIKEKEGHKRVSHIGQSAEANIFVEVYKRLPDDIFSLIIHDCILTTKENTKLVRRLLVERLRELYRDIIPPNESLEKVFKIEKVSNEYTIKAKG